MDFRLPGISNACIIGIFENYLGCPGCPVLVTGRYCEEHAKKVNSDYEKYGRDKSGEEKIWSCMEKDS